MIRGTGFAGGVAMTLGGVDQRPSSALLYAAVRDAYELLEHAFESHDPGAASEAARVWWESLQRLRAAS